MKIPDWYQLVLLVLAAFRVWRLLDEDTILDRPRRRLLRLGSWQQEGDPVPASYRKTLGNFISCPWCLGFHITLAWWGAYQWSPHWAIVVAVPWALSAVVGIIGSKIGEG